MRGFWYEIWVPSDNDSTGEFSAPDETPDGDQLYDPDNMDSAVTFCKRLRAEEGLDARVVRVYPIAKLHVEEVFRSDQSAVKDAPKAIRVAIELHRGLVNRVVSDHPGIEYVVLDDDFEGFDIDTIREMRIEPEGFDTSTVDPELKCVEEFNRKVDELTKELQELET